MILRNPKLILLLLVLTVSAKKSSADIMVDYTHDSFFAGNLTAKNALEAAVSDINSILFSSFNEITSAQDSVTGTQGGTTATFNHQFSYYNPTTGAMTTYNGGNTAIAANQIKVYVGMQNLTGATLGQGGPGSFGFGLAGLGQPSEWIQAVTNAQNASNAIYLRGGQGPVIGQLTGSSTFGAFTANYTLQYGNTIGNLWFDRDTNNDSLTDSAAQLDNFWHFDHTTAVAAGKFDFYSVAVHELLHSIGYGASLTWNQKVVGTNWTGANVISLLGSGNNVISADGGHVASNLNSIMNPAIASGVRETITPLDVAFMRDLGFSITAVPEPSSLLLVGVGASILFVRRRRQD